MANGKYLFSSYMSFHLHIPPPPINIIGFDGLPISYMAFICCNGHFPVIFHFVHFDSANLSILPIAYYCYIHAIRTAHIYLFLCGFCCRCCFSILIASLVVVYPVAKSHCTHIVFCKWMSLFKRMDFFSCLFFHPARWILIECIEIS